MNIKIILVLTADMRYFLKDDVDFDGCWIHCSDSIVAIASSGVRFFLFIIGINKK